MITNIIIKGDSHNAIWKIVGKNKNVIDQTPYPFILIEGAK